MNRSNFGLINQFKLLRPFVGLNVFLVPLLAFLSAGFEGVGVVLLLPLLIVAFDGETLDLDQFSSQIFDLLNTLLIPTEPLVLVLMVLAFFSLKAVFLFLSKSYRANLSAQLQISLKREMFDRIQRMPYQAFAAKDTGYLISVTNGYVNRLISSMQTMLSLVGAAGSAILYVGIAITASPAFGFSAIAVGWTRSLSI